MRSSTIAILVLACISLFTNLVGLAHVNRVIFDEFHFGKFVNGYCCTHERFFDIHPPHAKLLIAGAGYVAGYRGGLKFASIDEEYAAESVIPLRFLPAIAGAALPLVAFGILRVVGVSALFSFLGGLALALDNALTTQSRVVGLDSILLLATFMAIWLFLLWLRSQPGRKRNVWLLVGTGAFAGLAAGTKFTGLAALGIIGLTLLWLLVREFWNFHLRWRETALRYVAGGLTILGVAFAVYVIGWVVHVKILYLPGSGDAWGARTGHLITDIIQEHKAMLNANYNLTATHPYSSMWWSWPAMARPVFYWSHAGRWVYFIGNPIVWWGAALLFAIAATHYVFDKRIRKRQGFIAFLLLGYVVAYLPFVRIPRALFLYHYLTPLVFSLLVAIWWADSLLPEMYKKRIVVITSIFIVIGFVLFSPLTYGFDGWQESLTWFPGWR